mmetsp:Transcript_65587/g.181822  ORF Transcript_65587/g.181822 Transcript_65587/m.181822 type:complete len:203 (-) Transcript_65587:9-617(-)
MACNLLKKPSMDLSHSYLLSASSSRNRAHSVLLILFTMSMSCSKESSLTSQRTPSSSSSFSLSRNGSANFSQVFINMLMLVRRFFGSCFSVASQRIGLSTLSAAASVPRPSLGSSPASLAKRSSSARRSTAPSPVPKTESSMPPCALRRRCHRRLFLLLPTQASFSARVGTTVEAWLLPFPHFSGPPPLPLPASTGGPFPPF